MAISKTLPPSNTISPSVRITEKDLSFYDIGTSFHRSGLVGFASKGPVGIPTQIRSQRELNSVFGYPHPDVGDPYLIYAASQYLTIANELWIVRVADVSPTSWEAAKLASVEVPSVGGQVLIESDISENISAYEDVEKTIPAVGSTGDYSFDHDMYFRWRLNGILASKTLQILANANRPAPNIGLPYTALQLREDLNFQLSADDGIEFWVTLEDAFGVPIAAEDRKLSVFATNSFGPTSSIEFVSVIGSACGGATINEGAGNGTNVLGFGTLMERAVNTSYYDGYPSDGSLHANGTWDFSSLGSSVDLQLQVVIDGTDSVSIDNVVQVIDLNSLKAINGGVVTTADIVYAINEYISSHTVVIAGTTVTTSLPGGFQAIGGNVGGLTGGSYPVDDLHYSSPKDLLDSALTFPTAADNITLITNHFGRDAKLFVKPESTANAFFGFGADIDHPEEATAVGVSPTRYSGDADAYEGGIVVGSVNVTAETTFTVTADSVGIDGNNTMVQVRTDARSGTFSLYVFNNETQLESWGNLTKEVSSRFYVETFISIVSDWIRILDDLTNPATPASGDYYLIGGSDGIPADPDDQDALLIGNFETMSGMYALSEPEQVDIDLLAVPGHSSAHVMEALITVCSQQRMDCMAIIDPPFGLYIEEVIQWHNGIHPLNDVKLDSDFAALYWPWIKMTDGHNLVDVWVPPSGSILAVYANSDALSAPWFAPAGLNRGMLPSNISDVFDRPTLEERDLLYGWRNAVNPIVQFNDVDGFIVWGQKTLQRRPTALDRVNVRRMMFVAEKRIRAASRYLLFEPHDELFHKQFTDIASTILTSIQVGRGLTAYRILCDWTLNTPDRVDRNEFWARIGIQPTKAVEFIFIEFSIHRTGSWDSNITGF
jgi:hypothetical protein